MSLVMCRCGGIVDADVCSKCGPKKRVFDRPIHYGSKWDKYAKQYKLENPLCVNCLERGIVKPSEEVHHVIPVNEAPELMFEASNLKALCIPCHKQEDNERRRSNRGW